MAAIFDQFVLTGSTTTSTTGAKIVGSVVRGLSKYDWFTIDANLKGVPLGTLDVYIQRQVQTTAQQSGGVWADWVHFPQIAQAGARVYYTLEPQSTADLIVVGRGTDASAGTPALAANISVGGHPGDAVRLVAKCGSATLTGTSLTVSLNCWGRRL